LHNEESGILNLEFVQQFQIPNPQFLTLQYALSQQHPHRLKRSREPVQHETKDLQRHHAEERFVALNCALNLPRRGGRSDKPSDRGTSVAMAA